MQTLRAIHLILVASDPGPGHYLRYGAILLAAVLSIAVWMLHTWRSAPDPEERWRRAREELAERDDAPAR